MSDERYGDAAPEYWSKGWRGIIPIPYRTKELGLRGWTGHAGNMPSWPDVQAWMDNDSEYDGYQSNLAIRLPDNVIGIDVDQYGAHSGERCLAEAERRWGTLPRTVRSTSRTDRISGIRLFKVPPGTEFYGEVTFPQLRLDGIDIVQNTYRYVTAYPSVHPETERQYLWLDDDCERVEIPNITDLPELPEKWVDALKKDPTEITTEVNPFDNIRSFPQGRMDERVNKVYMDTVDKLNGERGARHQAALSGVLHLIRLGRERSTGVPTAFKMLEDVFIVKTSDRNTEDEARAEFRRMVFGERGHNLIESTPSARMDEIDLGYDEMSTPPPKVPRQATQAAAMPTDDEVIHQFEQQLGAVVLDDPEESEFLFGNLTEADYQEPAIEYNQGNVNRDELPFTQQLYKIGDLESVKPAEPLVDGLLYRNTLAQIAGDPGSYKTFFTLGLAMAIATPGMARWEGYKVEKHGPVIYVAAEGLSGMRARSLGWCQDQHVDHRDVEIYFFPRAFQLSNAEDLAELEKMINDIGAVLVVLDTRARVTLHVDENKSEEQTKLIDYLETIRQHTGTTFLAVHHSSRSGSAGRGSNAWDGAVWTELRSGKDGKGGIKVHCEKHKDAPSGCDHLFSMEPVVVNEDSMKGVPEKNRTTLICRSRDAMEPRHEIIAEAATIGDRILEHVKVAPTGGFTKIDLWNLAKEDDANIKRSSFYTALETMVKRSKIATNGKGGKEIRYGTAETRW